MSAQGIIEVPASTMDYTQSKTSRRWKSPSGHVVSLRELHIPRKARKLFQKGYRELHIRNRPELSQRHFQKAIDLYRDFDEAYVQLSAAYYSRGLFPEAQRVLEKALGVNPEYVRTLTLLGMAFNQQKENDKALQVLLHAAELDANAWIAHVEMGSIFLELGNIEEAFKHASQAHKLNPQAAVVQLHLYNVCIWRHDYDTALRELNEFLTLHPKDPLFPLASQHRDRLRGIVARTNAK